MSFLNTPLLDRDQRLGECYIIDGIEDNHFAIMIKVHHALIDGGGALKLFRKTEESNAQHEKSGCEKPARPIIENLENQS